MAPDGGYKTKIASAAFEVMLQRRGGLDIAAADAALCALAAASRPADRKGDDLANSGEFTRKHNGALYAVRDMLDALHSSGTQSGAGGGAFFGGHRLPLV